LTNAFGSARHRPDRRAGERLRHGDVERSGIDSQISVTAALVGEAANDAAGKNPISGKPVHRMSWRS
jgi:hypothetical protein